MGNRYSIEQRWDAVIWMGDFNSRIEEFNYHSLDEDKSIFEAIKRSDYDILSYHDQMRTDTQKVQNVPSFINPLHEGLIQYFAPSFKLKPGSDKLPQEELITLSEPLLLYNDKRTPAWTDRIFYWSQNRPVDFKNFEYQSIRSLKKRK